MKRLLLLLLVGSLFLGGCVSYIKPTKQALLAGQGEAPQAGVNYWWRYALRLTWPEGSLPNWYMDSLLADQLFAPVLREYSAQLPLWRFHRRAVRDSAGHRFSFLFYCDTALASQIMASIDKRYVYLENIGLKGVDAVEKYDINNPPKPGIAASSDPTWGIEIQKTWPYFIKGVSENWLRFIQSFSGPNLQSQEMPNFAALSALYQNVEKTIAEAWQFQGAHAYLHHLNAIFGYQKTILTERRLTQF